MSVKKQIKAENPYSLTSRTGQIENYRVFYPDDINSNQSWNIKKAQMTTQGITGNSVVGNGIIQTIVDGTIGSGLSCEPQIDVRFLQEVGIDSAQIDDIQDKIETMFRIWMNDPEMCDYYKQSNFDELARQGLAETTALGEMFAYITIRKHKSGYYFPLIQLISPLMVSSPNDCDSGNIQSGVELNEKGQAVAYYVKVVKPGEIVASEWVRIPKYSKNGRLQFIHLKGLSEFPNQLRGTSVLKALVEDLVQIDRFNNANLTKAELQASIAWSAESELGVDEEKSGSLIDEFKKQANFTADIPESPREPQTIKPGVMIEPKPGVHMKMIESTAPTQNYWDFVQGNLKLMSGARIASPEKNTKSYLASYSASQASMQESQRVFDIWKNISAKGFWSICYEQFIFCLVTQDLINLPHFFDSYFFKKAWSVCRWFGSALVHNDPVKAIKASLLAIQGGLSTPEKETRKLYGDSWLSTIKTLAKDQKIIKEYGVSVSIGNQEDNNEESDNAE